MTLFGRVLRFGDPESADVVIFDETGADELRKAIHPRHRVAVFPVRPDEVWMGFRVAGAFIRLVPGIRIAEARRHPRGVTRGLLKELRGIYHHACLAVIGPSAVVTFIDNSGEFAWLSRRCRQFPFIAIQNGTRLPSAVDIDPDYYLQHLFSFGRREIEEFPAMGYKVDNFHPVGSLRACLNWHQTSVSEDFDLVVVSTWRGNIGFPRDVADSMRSMRTMDELLAIYLQKRQLRGAVILRAARGGEHWTMPEMGMNEEEYVRSVYRGTADIIEADFVTRNVYPVMRSGRLVVTCLSTAVLEAFGWGKKVLYCNFTGTDLYHRGLDPAILTTDATQDGLFARLDALLAIPQAEYEERYRALRRYYIANPENQSTTLAITDGLDEIMASSKCVR